MTVRVTTRQTHELTTRAMSLEADRAQSWQKRLTSGNRLERVSQDAAASGRAVEISISQARLVMLKGNQDAAQASAENAESQVTSVTQVLDAMVQLSVQAQNGSFSPDEQKTLSAQVTALAGQLEGLVNAKDSLGRPMFPEKTHQIEIEPNVFVNMNVTRAEVLGPAISSYPGLPQDPDHADKPLVLAAVYQLRDRLNSGEPPRPGDVTALKEAHTTALMSRVRTGVTGQQIDSSRDAVDAAVLTAAVEKSALVDTDVVQASTELARSMTLLEATRSVFAKLSGTGLFQYLR